MTSHAVSRVVEGTNRKEVWKLIRLWRLCYSSAGFGSGCFGVLRRSTTSVRPARPPNGKTAKLPSTTIRRSNQPAEAMFSTIVGKAANSEGPVVPGRVRRTTAGNITVNHSGMAKRTVRTPNTTPLESVGFAGRSISSHQNSPADSPAASPMLSGPTTRGIVNRRPTSAPRTAALPAARNTQNRVERKLQPERGDEGFIDG